MSAIAELLDYSLRDEKPGDEAFLAELQRYAHDEDARFGVYSDEEQSAILAMECDLLRQAVSAIYPNARSCIVLVDGYPGGQLVVDRTVERIRLIEIAIMPALRRCGLGTRIVKGLCREAALRGVPIDLRVARSNHDAIRFYERHGFYAVDEDKAYLDMRWSGAGEERVAGSG